MKIKVYTERDTDIQGEETNEKKNMFMVKKHEEEGGGSVLLGRD